MILLWICGFFTGLLLFTIAGFLFCFKLVLYPKLNQKLPEFIKPKELPESIVNEIRAKLGDENDAEESALWLNGIINWIFLNLTDFSSPITENSLFSEIAVDLRRSPLGFFLKNSEFKSLRIGGSAPRIGKAKIITGSALTDPTSAIPLTLNFDLEYDGNCCISMEFDTIFNLKILTETLIKSLKASFVIVIQDRTVHFTFQKEPNTIEIDTSVSFSGDQKRLYHIPLLNYIASSSFLLKNAIKYGLSFPKFGGQWYRAGPEQPPYPWNPAVKANPSLLYTWTPKMD